MTISPGTRLGVYEITALLGAGGMGEVYRAYDSRLGRDVALKVLAPRLAGNRNAVARFEQEARSASALSHPHILHIYDIGTGEISGESIHFMTMELVDGVTLGAKMHDGTELPELLGWLLQVADGLARAHAAGIVHRDLKPENVMVTRDGYAKILDFGLAKLIESPIDPAAATMVGAAPKSVPGLIVGTAAYMAPEQAQGRPADERSDIFSFGCILYEAAARKRAFDSGNVIDTLHRIVHGEPDFGPLDPRIAAVVRKCLAKDPAARYASIKEVAGALRGITNPGAAPAVARDERKTIAVLPFDDLSPTRDNDYFAEGLADEITSDLSRVRSLRVISRASARRYKGENKDIAQVAADLGAAFVIDGSVRKAGNQLRVVAQLIDTATGTQLWSDKYSGTMDDVFDIQEKVARAVVERLQVELSSSEDVRLAGRTMWNVEAYECYLRAKRLIWRFDAEGLAAALREIDRGLTIAGPNAALLGAQGTVYWQYYNAGIDPDPAHLDRAEEIARAILASDPDSLDGLRLAGLVAVQKQQVPRAIRYLERALAADPNDVDTLLWLTFVGPIVGRDTSVEAERLTAIDPLNSFSWAMSAFPVFLEGRFDEALSMLQRARALEGIPIYDFLLAQFRLQSGRIEEAEAMLPHFEHEGHPLFGPLAVALIKAATGKKEQAREVLTEDVLRASRGDLQYSSWVAEIYAQAGDFDAAFDWLRNSITRGYLPYEFFATHDHLLEPLRRDPRFAELLGLVRRELQAIRSSAA